MVDKFIAGQADVVPGRCQYLLLNTLRKRNWKVHIEFRRVPGVTANKEKFSPFHLFLNYSLNFDRIAIK